MMPTLRGIAASFCDYRRSVAIRACLALGFLHSLHANAADLVAPPALYPPTVWQGKSAAVLRILRRVDSHVEVVTVPVGQDGQYKTLHFHVVQCVERPATLPSDDAAHLILHDDSSADPDFDGWIVRNEPALSTYANPLYNISVVRCDGNLVPPILGPLPSAPKPDPGISRNLNDQSQRPQGTTEAPLPHVLPSPPSGGAGPMPLDSPQPSAGLPAARPVIPPHDDTSPLQLAPS